jgi:hypothetical protein
MPGYTYVLWNPDDDDYSRQAIRKQCTEVKGKEPFLWYRIRDLFDTDAKEP